MYDIQEIDPKRFNKDVYFSSNLDERGNKRLKKTSNISYNANNTSKALNDLDVVKYYKRFLNICDENKNSSRYINNYIVSSMKVNKDTIHNISSSEEKRNDDDKKNMEVKFVLPSNLKLTYHSTKPMNNSLPKTKIWETLDKSENFKKTRAINLKKVLTSKRNIIPYIESLDEEDYYMIYNKVNDKLRHTKSKSLIKKD
ncbi:uncharacterized protein HGUI_00888 [Hanseniaspora guilliermondii]|uniref:Uncharacterized protein n=1 Tax=Hanseniaspora guilliermondii TaxID=56406 RepID=A0A1L0AX86_9ASCO|nr:uncharacterized protein HGUI_00888 [Hanseniaspora guilliermondii]